ncbi:TPA: hypothetical protein ACPVYZ_004240 [Vibrio parahaemolyticus]|uniref:hypothetical protein n=1 Tax=Vibrio parahaemolyticus TaxID=670 RepID=UPI00111F0677|nr:hypothetical protein [Vibrio parahaemolyticus]MBE4286395.1 hypothetical protein [Vibrio parahaemolyticus]TOH19151.1 hypothetical protein CGI90_04000 [Vibrio parahaemolyticus]HCG7330435.1 hypothetical protein [Vibrio parahaemolyticus]HCG8859898.1 hypothetical protein [Vibrio parahaemolyticus]HCG9589014.1 hypothetical protein [Vibrio parahaemolyticus]
MFRIMKNPETGEAQIRPMLVGSIKNKYARRVAIIVAWPLTLSVTFSFNYLYLIFSTALRFIGMTFKHVLMMLQPPWNSEVWNRPRTDKDEWMS